MRELTMVYGCKVDYGKLKLVNINEKVVRLTRYIPLIQVHIFLPFCEFDEQGLRKKSEMQQKRNFLRRNGNQNLVI